MLTLSVFCVIINTETVRCEIFSFTERQNIYNFINLTDLKDYSDRKARRFLFYDFYDFTIELCLARLIFILNRKKVIK